MIKTIEQLAEYVLGIPGNIGERAINSQLLDLITQQELSKEVFLEYLEITQGPVGDLLEECFRVD